MEKIKTVPRCGSQASDKRGVEWNEKPGLAAREFNGYTKHGKDPTPELILQLL